MVDMTKWPPISFGWIVAFVVGLVACILWGLDALGRDVALVILAICSRRL